MDPLHHPTLSPDQESQIQHENEKAHHRRNHRSGTKERARRERKSLNGSVAGSTCGSPTGTEFSFCTTRGKKSYRSGVKVRERRARREENLGENKEELNFKDSIVEDLVLEDSILEDMVLEESPQDESQEINLENHGGNSEHDNDLETTEEPPSLTYDFDDADAHSDHELSTSSSSSEDIPVRERADTGSFEEKVESEIGMLEPSHPKQTEQIVQPTETQQMLHHTEEIMQSTAVNVQGIPNLNKKAKAAGSRDTNQKIKHEIKLWGLKRPEVLKGREEVKVVVPRVKHEVKLLSLMGTKKLKQGEII
jgi:hypothetical protein